MLEPFTVVVGMVGPPLSLKKKISVFSSSPAARSATMVRPTPSSIADSIAAYVRRCSFAIWVKRARYLSVACIGVCTALNAR